MKKRITAALAAVLLLCGCASSAADGTTDPAADGKNEDTAVLVIENITQDPEPADTAELEAAVNAITVRRSTVRSRSITVILTTTSRPYQWSM